MDEIKVISSDLDGKELRLKKTGKYLRCYGRDDQEQINDAISSSHDSPMYVIASEDWVRIFGGRHGK